ncbi:MAG: 2-dehydropantoate 2-reductase [SAR202 cluster bacterium]|nr:2-dehydropantoate 2-reductase [SAR202 cluster bacterium]
MQITIFGAGAIGGLTGALLEKAGQPVTLVDKVADHVRCINADGLRVTGFAGEFRVRPKALEPHQLKGPLDTVFLCVKSLHTLDAMNALMPHLGPKSTLVCFQNGVNEETIAKLIGPQRTVGCLVQWGGDYQSPGHIEYGNHGPYQIGELDGRTTPRLVELQKVLSKAQETFITGNIMGHKWSKQVWGYFYIGNALGTSPVPAMFANPRVQRILYACFKEGIAVCQADGIKLEPFAEVPFDPPAFAKLDFEATLPLFQQYADHYRPFVKVFSGPWRDIAVRKRPTEVDYVLGPFVEKGRQCRIPTPLTERMIALVKDVEQGRRQQDDANILELEKLL